MYQTYVLRYEFARTREEDAVIRRFAVSSWIHPEGGDHPKWIQVITPQTKNETLSTRHMRVVVMKVNRCNPQSEYAATLLREGTVDLS